MTDRDLVKSLLKLHAIRVAKPGEEFTLASGEKSRFYCDVKKMALCGRGHVALASTIFDAALKAFHLFEAVAGVALGGCHLASIVAMHAAVKHTLALDVIHVRKQAKEHGTRSLVERPWMTGYKHVVLIEDVVTTGGSSLQAAEHIRQEKLNVVGILAVVDRRKERTDYLGPYPFVALFPFEEITEDDL